MSSRLSLGRWAVPGLLLLLVLPALWPLAAPGFFVSDDGRFHVYRIAALAEAWQHGVLHPRLFPSFGFGYGQAVLNFYAPLSYWPGALFTLLGFGPATAAQLTIALGFVLAALAAFGYIRSLWGADRRPDRRPRLHLLPLPPGRRLHARGHPRAFRLHLPAPHPLGLHRRLPQRAPTTAAAVGRRWRGRVWCSPTT